MKNIFSISVDAHDRLGCRGMSTQVHHAIITYRKESIVLFTVGAVPSVHISRGHLAIGVAKPTVNQHPGSVTKSRFVLTYKPKILPK